MTFVSTIPSDWGGSEELWAASAEVLLARGYDVSVFKALESKHHKKLERLISLGCRLLTPAGYRLPFLVRLRNRCLPYRYHKTQQAYYGGLLRRTKPDLVVISQGWNWDGLAWAKECQGAGIPYALISHQASIRGWPSDADVADVAAAHLNARGAFYVAERLLERTEEMIGAKIPHAEIVRNPFNVKTAHSLPWPAEDQGFRLACVGRFEFKDKGQDVLIRVMGTEKWRRRDLTVSFFGSGINREGMQRLIEYTGATNCQIVGHTDSVEELWRNHHALILPSREEGLPLVVVEAMLCGRPCIVTDVVGNAELLTEGHSGFVCPAPTAALLDETLERAWQKRESWKSMGERAGADVRKAIPADPGAVFADRLTALLSKGK